MMEWSRNDGMMQEWVWDEILIGSEKSVHPTPSAEGVGWTDFTLRMTGMIHGWLNDLGIGMMHEWVWDEILIGSWWWLLNDRMMVEWRNEDRMAVIKIELTERNCQNRGFLLVESSKSRPLIGREDPQKNLRGWPWFENVRHSSVILTLEWQNDRITYEWLNDLRMTEWLLNDRMTL